MLNVLDFFFEFYYVFYLTKNFDNCLFDGAVEIQKFI